MEKVAEQSGWIRSFGAADTGARHRRLSNGFGWLIVSALLFFGPLAPRNLGAAAPEAFDGKFVSGKGDVEYLQLLDTARRMFAPDPEFQNLSMLYMSSWNGLVEGPTWDAWWIQNSYGPTYCALPFLEEPFVTFLNNSHDLWFSQMGDGKRAGAAAPFNWVAPDGCLCDAARPGWIVYKQGDGRTAIHDWGMEFTAAGLLMQSELLLISRDPVAIASYLPKLERCARFIETRRDPTNNLFLAGPAANLLAPSYAGWKKPDGSYGQAYLAGLSVTYVAALDRLIELEKLAAKPAEARALAVQRDSAKAALRLLSTDEGYLIRSLDPDGTRHGVYGAAQHGYFEASPNHDAICFRVADDAQAEKILRTIMSISGLRPHAFVIPNYPSYDDMYEKPEGLWTFGTWVNGGHWSTCEARMIMAYCRLGRFEDARASMKQLMTFSRSFRMDNPLVKFGSEVYQPREPINLTYDAFGPPAALIRGLFEYLYDADGVTIIPHLPDRITELQQHFPIRLGSKRLYLSVAGQGPITRVFVNGREWKDHDQQRVKLPHDALPETAEVCLLLGTATEPLLAKPRTQGKEAGHRMPIDPEATPVSLQRAHARLLNLQERLAKAGASRSYEAAHVQLAIRSIEVISERHALLTQKKIPALPEPTRSAAEKLYLQSATRLGDGLDRVLESYEHSQDPRQRQIYSLSTE